MSEIAELRKLLQDLIAPDLKALNVEMKSSAELATARHNEIKAQIGASEARTDASLAVMDSKLIVMDSKIARIEGKVDLLIERLEIEKRLPRIESIHAPGLPNRLPSRHPYSSIANC